MKRLHLILFAFITLHCSAQSFIPASRIPSYAFTLPELRSKPPGGDSYCILVNLTTKGDGKAGFGYYYDSTSMLTEDTVTMNVVQPTGLSMGRWIRANAKVVVYSWGTTINNNGLIEFFTSGTLDGSGFITANLTNNSDTTAGTPIFKTLLDFSCISSQKPASANAMITINMTDYGGTYKWVKFLGVKPALVTVALISLTVRVADVAAVGTPVLVHIVGR